MNTPERDDIHGLMAVRWHGWGSPVGLGLFALLISASILLVRVASR